jgi:hypothetical protein
MPIAWKEMTRGRLVSIVGALVIIASGAFEWESVTAGNVTETALGVEVVAGISAIVSGLFAFVVLLVGKERRFRHGAAGAGFIVTVLVAARYWLLLEEGESFLQFLGYQIRQGNGPLLALAGAAIGIAGLMWSVLETPRLTAPALPDVARWK